MASSPTKYKVLKCPLLLELEAAAVAADNAFTEYGICDGGAANRRLLAARTAVAAKYCEPEPGPKFNIRAHTIDLDAERSVKAGSLADTPYGPRYYFLFTNKGVETSLCLTPEAVEAVTVLYARLLRDQVIQESTNDAAPTSAVCGSPVHRPEDCSPPAVQPVPSPAQEPRQSDSWQVVPCTATPLVKAVADAIDLIREAADGLQNSMYKLNDLMLSPCHRQPLVDELNGIAYQLEDLTR